GQGQGDQGDDQRKDKGKDKAQELINHPPQGCECGRQNKCRDPDVCRCKERGEPCTLICKCYKSVCVNKGHVERPSIIRCGCQSRRCRTGHCSCKDCENKDRRVQEDGSAKRPRTLSLFRTEPGDLKTALFVERIDIISCVCQVGRCITGHCICFNQDRSCNPACSCKDCVNKDRNDDDKVQDDGSAKRSRTLSLFSTEPGDLKTAPSSSNA
ncbi:hypothetical protein PIB30_048380, partial [Stylosanthes scabra]|nr:hypothetical protein [Stylosanthes scabra]